MNQLTPKDNIELRDKYIQALQQIRKFRELRRSDHVKFMSVRNQRNVAQFRVAYLESSIQVIIDALKGDVVGTALYEPTDIAKKLDDVLIGRFIPGDVFH